MMQFSQLRELLTHLEWADAVMWTAVLGSDVAAADDRVRELLRHSHETEWAYLQLWRGEPVRIPDPEDWVSAAAVAAWARRFHQELAGFAASLDEASLGREMEFPWAEQLASRFGQVHPTSLRQAILQVCLHSSYHRGQANARLRELGVTPPMVDFVAWLWAGRPAAAWPPGSVD